MKNWKNSDGLNQQELYNTLNQLLKDAKTSKDLEYIIDKVEAETIHPIYFIMKRSDKVITKFSIQSDKVDYILDDGFSKRSSRVSNLYRNVFIGE